MFVSLDIWGGPTTCALQRLKEKKEGDGRTQGSDPARFSQVF